MTKRNRTKTKDTVFTFSCAQSREREHKVKVPLAENANARARRRMARFDCDGWLHIVASDTSAQLDIKIKHDESHLYYADISLPPKWKEYIEEHARSLTPGQVRSN